MNLSRFVYLYLWIAPHLLLVPVAILMLRRRLHKEFPIFFFYLLLSRKCDSRYIDLIKTSMRIKSVDALNFENFDF